eukprot:745039-Amphidinium_carterae.1
MEDLARMRDALRDIIITGRRQRLQEVQDAQRQVPKAPPQGIRQPYHQKALQDMTLQELRAKVRAEEERAERRQGGAYVAPTIPDLQKYKDRIEELEDRAQQEEDRRNRLQEQEQRHRVQEKAQKEREEREAEDLERQAVNTEVPADQVQLEVSAIPAIGENVEVQTIASLTGQSSTSE